MTHYLLAHEQGMFGLIAGYGLAKLPAAIWRRDWLTAWQWVASPIAALGAFWVL